ncbi:MAG TPA: circularly permuted type 2 ATP-grasp protein, partial [Novosphingobium sp.]|nr:circularly permuted type 2 ATP-grasp protein [Novosphingobium sp.]
MSTEAEPDKAALAERSKPAQAEAIKARKAEPDAEPAGQAQGSDWLAGYPQDAAGGDLFRGAEPSVAKRWAQVAGGLSALAGGNVAGFEEQLGRQIREQGLTYRVTGDAEERDWPLTPMPLLIGADEWAQVERGLIQRARLLEAVVADIYGPQMLVQEGHIPAAVVAGSPYFARSMVGLQPLAGHFLHVYAVDLARGPGGQWRVLADRMRLANGVGYALENRLAISRSSAALLADAQVRRLSGFFAHMRDGIAHDCARENPRIALLTPGRLNQSHSEQAYLARYLGLPLVEGRDLMVADERLYLRTIAGPKRIDALWRWIDTNALDPLHFDARSGLGVPDLFSAWARGGLEMANWPGVEVIESRALTAFLPRLFGVLLDEEALLPNIATWWCGQEAEADHVRERMDELVIAPAFASVADALAGKRPVAGAALGKRQRETLLAAMARRPMDY